MFSEINNDYKGNNLHTQYDNRTFNTENVTKHTNSYSNDCTKDNINNTNKVKETHYNFIGDIAISKTSNIYPNETFNITINNKLLGITYNDYFINKYIIQVIALIIQLSSLTILMEIVLYKVSKHS